MKAYWRSGGTAPRILDFGTRWKRVVGFTLRPLYTQGKSRWYPLDNVARTRDMLNAYISVGKTEQRSRLGDTGIDGTHIIKRNLKEVEYEGKD